MNSNRCKSASERKGIQMINFFEKTAEWLASCFLLPSSFFCVKNIDSNSPKIFLVKNLSPKLCFRILVKTIQNIIQLWKLDFNRRPYIKSLLKKKTIFLVLQGEIFRFFEKRGFWWYVLDVSTSYQALVMSLNANAVIKLKRKFVKYFVQIQKSLGLLE